VHLLHSQRTDGGDKAGLAGLSLTERKAPTRTAHEISADMPRWRLLGAGDRSRTDQVVLRSGDHPALSIGGLAAT
jgi:hypothetical protein